MKAGFLADCYPHLEKSLIEEITQHSIKKDFLSGEKIVEQGQYMKYLPIVVSGNVKVFSQEDAIQFLLYYISSGGSCIYSFAHILRNEKADFSAIADTDSTLLLLPVERVKLWMGKYPSFGNLVLDDFQKHYSDLLSTTKQLICFNLEERLIEYLRTKTKIENSNLLNISHREIADDLGTSREVITRVMKKLGANQKIQQQGRKVKVL
ncbi:Crp/Fnr family transcriptional regulator [Flagellimonas sp.]|uniref:Crp/Fnr family transcriptional regulator n=1 Tax=Flagellimonas sp. TaxID=2058762 RepID=UPI003B591243